MIENTRKIKVQSTLFVSRPKLYFGFKFLKYRIIKALCCYFDELFDDSFTGLNDLELYRKHIYLNRLEPIVEK